MTNAEKYLKNGTATEELIGEMETSLCVPYYEVARFWNKQIKHTLTEDERAILNELPKKYKYISRNLANELQLRKEPKSEEMSFCDAIDELYNHLFQFIKKRRRIQHTRVVR